MAASMEEDEFIGNYNKDCHRCGCFRQLCSDWAGAARTHLYRNRRKITQRARGGEGWFIKMRKKAKEASEIIAGFKWKNFIRKFGCVKKRNATQQFYYDSRSYALNFDSRNGREDCEDAPQCSFSDQFARPVQENCDESNRVLPADC